MQIAHQDQSCGSLLSTSVFLSLYWLDPLDNCPFIGNSLVGSTCIRPAMGHNLVSSTGILIGEGTYIILTTGNFATGIGYCYTLGFQKM